MEQQRYVHYICTADTFRPTLLHPVRWLEWEKDLPLVQAYWGMDTESFRRVWLEAREEGFHYCAVIEDGRIIASAASWRYSDPAWELAAVHVKDPVYRRRGYATSVCSFITAAILLTGRLATCTTLPDNLAMQRTAERIGFRRRD
ncbi:MAG: GNAT family N-acetyltransferase [Armatimonadota bacterium]